MNPDDINPNNIPSIKEILTDQKTIGKLAGEIDNQETQFAEKMQEFIDSTHNYRRSKSAINQAQNIEDLKGAVILSPQLSRIIKANGINIFKGGETHFFFVKDFILDVLDEQLEEQSKQQEIISAFISEQVIALQAKIEHLGIKLTERLKN